MFILVGEKVGKKRRRRKRRRRKRRKLKREKRRRRSKNRKEKKRMKVGFDAAAFMSTTLAAGERSGGGRVSMGEGVRNFALIMNVRRLVLHRCDLAGNRPC